MKRIIKLAICIICLFIYIDEAKADSVYTGSTILTEGASNVSKDYGQWLNEDDKAYRVTLVDKNGEKIRNTKSVDYFLSSLTAYNIAMYGKTTLGQQLLTYYDSYKFATSISNTKNPGTNVKLISSVTSNFGCSNDSGNDKIIKCWENQLKNSWEESDSFFHKILENAGIRGEVINQLISKKSLYVLIEPIFLVSYPNTYTYQIKNEPAVGIGNPRYYMGTASEISLNLLKSYENETTKVEISGKSYYAKWINGKIDIKNDYENGYSYLTTTFNIATNPLVQPMATDMYMSSSNVSDIKNVGFNRNITSASSSGVTCSSSNKYLCSTTLQNISNSSSGYGFNMFIPWHGNTTFECTLENHELIGQDWNPKTNQCCPIDTKYNSSTGKCEEPTPSTTSDFVFKATTNANICESNTKSTFETISRCDEVSPSSLKGVPKVNCVYKNEAYKDGNVYCYDEVTVNTGNVLNQFSNIKSGAIIPITSFPTATVTKTCYSSNASTALSYVNNSENYDIGSIYLNAGSYDDNSYQLTPGISLPRTTSTSSGKTLWYEKYYSATNTATIEYKYANSILNNYIDIETYLGNNSVTNKEQIKVNTPVNITVPVSTQSGNYTSSVTMSKCGAINNIYELEKGFNLTYIQNSDCTGMCTIKRSYDTAYSRNAAASYFEDMGYSIKKDATSYTSTSCKKSSGGEEICTSTTSWTYSLKATKDKVTLSECQEDSNKKNYTFKSDCQTITFKKDSKDISDDLTCEKSYNIINELTSDPDDPSQPYSLLNKLVYRPIDLSNPFPGINGTGRTAGSNWSTADIRKYITNRQDVYTKTPLYSITLTPAVIKQIRSYNETHDYDDFTLNCIGNGTSCLSTFLRTTIKNSVNTNKSTCFNITENASAFSNCAESRW